jgi:ribosomal protein S18 acetylase RimI-like enzyme
MGSPPGNVLVERRDPRQGAVGKVGLVAVRAGEQRRGIGRALLAHVLGPLHGSGFAAAWAEAHESNQAVSALFEGIGPSR